MSGAWLLILYGVQETDLGRTLFEADRMLKLMSTGFEAIDLARWMDRPANIATELDLMGAEIAQEPSNHYGGWHRFWFEFTDDPFEAWMTHPEIPRDGIFGQDESIPPTACSQERPTVFGSDIDKLCGFNRKDSSLSRTAENCSASCAGQMDAILKHSRRHGMGARYARKEGHSERDSEHNGTEDYPQ